MAVAADAPSPIGVVGTGLKALVLGSLSRTVASTRICRRNLPHAMFGVTLPHEVSVGRIQIATVVLRFY